VGSQRLTAWKKNLLLPSSGVKAERRKNISNTGKGGHRLGLKVNPCELPTGKTSTTLQDATSLNTVINIFEISEEYFILIPSTSHKKSTIWVLTTCSPIKVNRGLRRTFRFYLLGRILLISCFDPEDWDDTFLRNVGGRLPDYPALQPWRSYSSSSSLWQPQIQESHILLFTHKCKIVQYSRCENVVLIREQM
jgi:hypothetical protein